MPNTQIIWLVGASSGIGKALVEKLLQPGVTLYISARSEDKLKEIANQYDKVYALPMDMTKSEDVRWSIDKINAQHGHLDTVIFNAGTCEYMNGDALEQDAIQRVFETNFFALTRLTEKVIPLLKSATEKKHSKPKLVFIGSSVTYLALPRACAYGGSKAALRYFAESIYNDLKHLKIDVRVVSPGFVETPLTDNNDFDMPFLISAEKAADYIVKGLNGSRFDIHFPRRLTWSLKLINALPTRWRFAITSKMSKLAPQK